MKASEKAKKIWYANRRRPAYAKMAGKARWLDGDTKPRIPKGGPKGKA